jgi:hypothetical protein
LVVPERHVDQRRREFDDVFLIDIRHDEFASSIKRRGRVHQRAARRGLFVHRRCVGATRIDRASNKPTVGAGKQRERHIAMRLLATRTRLGLCQWGLDSIEPGSGRLSDDVGNEHVSRRLAGKRLDLSERCLDAVGFLAGIGRDARRRVHDAAAESDLHVSERRVEITLAAGISTVSAGRRVVAKRA